MKIFFDRSIITASILDAKRKFEIDEIYTTIKEIIYWEKIIMNKVGKENLDICFNDSLDEYYFENIEGLIKLKEEDSLSEVFGNIYIDQRLLFIISDKFQQEMLVKYHKLSDEKETAKKLGLKADN